jgi:hypothetical protein
LGRCLAAFQAYFYRFQRLALISGLYVVVVVSVTGLPVPLSLMSNKAHGIVLFSIAGVSLLTNVVLSIQVVVAYATLGDYATSFHMIRPHGGRLLTELKVITWRVITTL